MRFFIRLVASVTFLTQAAAKTLEVNVGQHGIAYSPNTTQASVGDTIQFNIYNNHSVVESSFASPCQPLTNGFYSGVIESCLNCGAAPEHFILTVKDTQPHWFYCSQKSHCNDGMVGVINPPSDQPGELAAYAIGAANINSAASPNSLSPPSAPLGGIISSIPTSTPSSPSITDQSFTFILSGFNSVTPSAPSDTPSSPQKTNLSESYIIYIPNNETNTMVTSVNIIYSPNRTTPAAITTTVKGATPTSSQSTVTSTKVFSAITSPTSTASGSATSSAAPSASTTKASTAPSAPSRGSNGGLWLPLFVYLGVILFSAW